MKDPFADIVSGQNNSDPFADIVASHQQQSVKPMPQATSLPKYGRLLSMARRSTQFMTQAHRLTSLLTLVLLKK